MTCPHPKHHAAKQCLACYSASRAAAPKTTPSAGPSYEEHGNKAVKTVASDVEIKTLDVMLRTCEVDTSTWDVERWICNTWANKWQVKVWLRRRVELVAARHEIAALLADAKSRAPQRARSVHDGNGASEGGPHMLEVNIPDLHLGKLAWSKETGHADYDIAIARRIYLEALERVINRVRGFGLKQILFPVGSDFLNADNKAALTTRGTPQDVDSRYPKMFEAGRQLMTDAIDRLRLIAPVHVPVVPGNHDELSAWHLGHSLECFFAKTKGVTIDNTPTQRKYVEFGKVMLLLTHGDKGKVTDYPLLMASEQPAMWGRTTFHEAHVGHFHQTKVQEKNGARVRTLSALCAPDAWHAGMGYVGNLRSAEGFVWHETEGLVAQSYYTVPEVAA